MSIDWIPRLRGHADLVKRLVEEVLRALDRPGLTLEQANRLHAVIQKGERDFDEVGQMMAGPDVEEYHNAADSLAKIWSHLADAAVEKIQNLKNEATVESGK
jgi:hypothetical protein